MASGYQPSLPTMDWDKPIIVETDNPNAVIETKDPYNTKIVTTVKPKVTKIFDYIDDSNIGYLYWHQNTLDKIAELSGPLAVHNEFQIHYWALVVRQRFDDNSIIDIAFPTVIYNYAQEVTSAHIDFELSDVSAMSEALEPVHNMVVNKLLKQLGDTSKHFELISVPLNTMHRHPTNVASFSGTDLRKDHESDTGIVFPLKTGDLTPSFSSIIYNNPVQLVHTEYRLASGDVDAEGIEYFKGGCLTYVAGNMSHVSDAQRFVGVMPHDQTYTVTRSNTNLTEGLKDFFANIDYEPNTDFINAENLTQKVYKTTPTVAKSTYSKPVKNNDQITFVYNKSQVADIKSMFKVDILDFAVIDKMSEKTLIPHINALEAVYYNDLYMPEDQYEGYSKKELIEIAMEIQDLIVAEYDELFEDAPPSTSYDRMTGILSDNYGMPY